MNYKDMDPKNKVCIYALRGAHLRTSGIAVPCCISKQHHGDSKSTIQQQRNNEWWRKLRQDLAAGVETPVCKTCWHSESVLNDSYRMRANHHYRDILEQIDIHTDGTLDSDEINLWDIRDNNICNMGCVSCGSHSSSLINQESFRYKDDASWQRLFPTFGDSTVVYGWDESQVEQQIIPNLGAHTRHLYFAGGEPLINRTHYLILKHLIENQWSRSITLFYNTNLLKVNHFGEDLWGQWRQFKQVNVGVSIDAVGTQAEWARWGTNWDRVDANCRSLIASGSVKQLGINTTHSCYTIFGLHRVIDWFESTGFNGQLRFSVAWGADWLKTQIIDLETRQQLVEKLEARYPMYTDPRYSQWDILKTELLDNSWDADRVAKARHTAVQVFDKIDSVRGTNWRLTFPRLQQNLENNQ